MTVVMSPVQLAAVLSDKSVTEAETLSNRSLGGAPHYSLPGRSGDWIWVFTR